METKETFHSFSINLIIRTLVPELLNPDLKRKKLTSHVFIFYRACHELLIQTFHQVLTLKQ